MGGDGKKTMELDVKIVLKSRGFGELRLIVRQSRPQAGAHGRTLADMKNFGSKRIGWVAATLALLALSLALVTPKVKYQHLLTC